MTGTACAGNSQQCRANIMTCTASWHALTFSSCCMFPACHREVRCVCLAPLRFCSVHQSVVWSGDPLRRRCVCHNSSRCRDCIMAYTVIMACFDCLMCCTPYKGKPHDLSVLCLLHLLHPTVCCTIKNGPLRSRNSVERLLHSPQSTVCCCWAGVLIEIRGCNVCGLGSTI
jgi:hypothetical protein